ncbi:MAG TPA: ADP-glyceromanno-heptose 6-epimerase [Caulobacteraceae bacterium]|jgi:ADP-L-glycero-D-manno-heptose 6-epimerase|nr:ADP-glyceromanno-heptose 6-epimerase [Caulobacteraceae bacterium]
MTRRIVFVTGGAGFIGSNIAAKLAEDRDLDVVVCDRLRGVELGKWRNIAKHPIADFVEPEAMFDWLETHVGDVEAVVHMGAVSSTTEPDADKILQTNFALSRDLYRWCAERRRRLIYASSAATYGDGSQGFADKDDLDSLIALRPLNAYGWSKALFDIFAVREAARGHAPPQWVGLKFFNVYGPNEGHKGSMKSVAAQIWPKVAAGGGVSLFKSHREGYADGGQQRDFVYVRDAADVVAWLLAHEEVDGVYNLGSGKARSFRDLAEAVFKAVGKPAKIDYIDTPPTIRAHYQYFTEADMGRLKAAGYTAPLTSLEDGVGDYVGAYLATADPYR